MTPDQPPAARVVHLREQYRGAVVIVAAVRRRVRRVDASPDNGGLVTHDINAFEQNRQRVGITHIVDPASVGRVRTRAVRSVEHRVDRHDIVAGGG